MIEVSTPSGYKVFLKDFLSFGDKRSLMAIMYENIKVKPTADAQKPDIDEIPLTFMSKVEDRALELLVVKIEKPEQVVVTTGFHKEIMSWKEEDGQAVMNKINEITALFKAPTSSTA
jgi:hypothetical protein